MLHIAFIQSASSAEEFKGQTSVKVGDDGVDHTETKSSSSKELDLTSTASGLTAATSEISVSQVLGLSEADNPSVNGMHSFCFVLKSNENNRCIACFRFPDMLHCQLPVFLPQISALQNYPL
jgi:hypothetical protein